MAIKMVEREEAIERLHPSIFSSRYYYLNQLRKQIEIVCKQFIQNKKDLVLIDYGCGNMPYESLFKPFVKEYIGVDLVENPRAKIHINREGKIQLEDSSVDVVLSTQVLEHVENPDLYLSEAFRVLKPGGMAIITTHGYWMYHPDPTDYWRWTSAGLAKIISNAGFEVKSFKGILGRSAMGLLLFQDGLIFKLPKFLRPAFSAFMQPWIMLFDKINKQEAIDRDGCTYIVVGVKK